MASETKEYPVAEVIKKMIDFYHGNPHDINHFLKVYSYAKTIGELEHLSPRDQGITELTAAVHDIACPLCREKYGEALGKYQEEESEALLRNFFSTFTIDSDVLERVIYIVCHHHTVSPVDGIDYQIMLEADYLVNANENSFSREAILHAKELFFRTVSGCALLDSVYSLN